jgi:hypothetical protein
MYQNTIYRNEREHRKTLILDIGNTEGLTTTNHTFTSDLQDIFRIDEISEVYLDSFTTYGTLRNYDASENIGFLLSIDEINTPTNSNNNTSFQKIFIPNLDDAGGATSSVQHKSKKMNYIGTINSCDISSISGSFTLMDGTTAITDTNSRFIAELVFVKQRYVGYV